MEKQVFLAMAMTLSFGPFLTNGLCQGAAEYSITTSHTASATVRVGSALHKATSQVAGRVQEKLSKSTRKPRQMSRQPSRVPADQAVRAKAQTVGSADGIEVIGGLSDTKTTDTKQKAGSRSEHCVSSPGEDSPGSKGNLPCKPESKEEYPSVVNLSFPK